MMCPWKQLLSILPPGLRREMDSLESRPVQELRLRLHAPPEVVLADKSLWLSQKITQDDLNFVVNTASRYSPWAAATAARGYLTAPGGHRIGLCGEAVVREGIVEGIRDVRSLCIRVARDFPGIGEAAAAVKGSLVILGAPGWGKTTLLRDLVRAVSRQECVSVIDERGELFPEAFSRGKRMDVLTGCPKPAGIEMTLRTMGPDCIAVDEITAAEDAMAMVQAANCGVRLLATAHAGSSGEFRRRPGYRPLVENRVFDTIAVLHADKSYHLERMTL